MVIQNPAKPKSRFQPQAMVIQNPAKPKSRFQTQAMVIQNSPGNASLDGSVDHETKSCYDTPGSIDSEPQQKFDEANF